MQQWRPLNHAFSFQKTQERHRAGSRLCCTLSFVGAVLVQSCRCEAAAQQTTQLTGASGEVPLHHTVRAWLD